MTKIQTIAQELAVLVGMAVVELFQEDIGRRQAHTVRQPLLLVAGHHTLIRRFALMLSIHKDSKLAMVMSPYQWFKERKAQ